MPLTAGACCGKSSGALTDAAVAPGRDGIGVGVRRGDEDRERKQHLVEHDVNHRGEIPSSVGMHGVPGLDS